MRPHDDTSTSADRQSWAKVPVCLLSAGLSSVELRVMIALLSFADPRRPGKEVWAKLRTIARMIGLAETRSGDNKVSRAITHLVQRGFIENRTAPGRGLRLSLKPFLAGLPSPKQGETPSPKSGEAPGPTLTQIGGGPSPESGDSTEQTTEQTKQLEQTRDQTTGAGPASGLSGRSRSQSHGNGERPMHPEAEHPAMADAWRNAEAHGVTCEGFARIIDSRHDLSAEEISSSVCAWVERIGGERPEKPDASLRGWLKKERGFQREAPRMSDDLESFRDDWTADGSPNARQQEIARRQRERVSAAKGWVAG